MAYTILPIFVLTIIPKNKIDNNRKFEKRLIIFYILFNLINFTVLFNVISVLGIDLASLYQYPDYHVLRRISIGGFIERIESLLAIQWMFCIYMMLILCFNYIITSLNDTFKFKKTKFFNFIIPIITIALSLIVFKNNTIANNFIVYIYPTILIIFFLIVPFIIYLFMHFKFKKTYEM